MTLPAGCMKRSSVCLSVCLSVCPIVRQPLRRAAAECTASSEYRDSASAGAQQQRRRHGARSTTLSSKCWQCRVDSRGTRLSTDLSIRAVTVSDMHHFVNPSRFRQMERCTSCCRWTRATRCLTLVVLWTEVDARCEKNDKYQLSLIDQRDKIVL